LSLSGGKTHETPQYWSGKGELLVPVLDQDGHFWAAQSIDDTGRKSFPRGSKLQGGHFPIGDLNASDTLLMAEGYATAATLHELTGLPVIVAFNSGNLPLVAEIYRERYPEKTLVIAGDNDHTKPIAKNVGFQKAQEAAQAVGGFVLLPTFEKNTPGSDWNDLWKAQGTQRTQAQLQVGLNQAKAQKQAIREREKDRKTNLTITMEKTLVVTGGRSLER
jgi:putative DNA primase/helicase